MCISADLEAVHLQLFWLDEFHPRQPLADVLALVSLQLQHLAVLWVLHNSSVTSELLLARLDYLL